MISETNLPDELTDAKVAASKARTDPKLEAFRGQIGALSLKLDQISQAVGDQRAEANANRTAVVSTVVAVGFALAGLLIAVVTYGDAIFSREMSVRDIVKSVVEEQQVKAPKAP